MNWKSFHIKVVALTTAFTFTLTNTIAYTDVSLLRFTPSAKKPSLIHALHLVNENGPAGVRNELRRAEEALYGQRRADSVQRTVNAENRAELRAGDEPTDDFAGIDAIQIGKGLDRIDGFDASFAGWGREDSDLLVRLLRSGVRRKDGNFATSVLHLWHAAADRSALPQNEQRLAHVLHDDRVRAESGLSALRTNAAARSGAA